MPLCLRPGWSRCCLRLVLDAWQPGDRAVLRPCQETGCSVRTVLTSGEIFFGFLHPGAYVLTLEHGTRCTRLLIDLPPGANLSLRWHLGQGRGWQRQDLFHAFFNRP